MDSVVEQGLYTAAPMPFWNIPPGAAVRVQVIDIGARIQAPVGLFMGPPISRHEVLSLPALSFLVEQARSGRKILFDLSLRKDWQSLAPAVMKILSTPGWKLDGHRNVADILQGHGVDVAGGAIEAVI